VQCVWFNVIQEDLAREQFKSVYKGKPIFATVSGKRDRVLTQIEMPADTETAESLLLSLENEVRAIYKSDLR